MNMIEVEVSGSFKTQPGTDKDRKSFSGLKIVMPNCPSEYYTAHALRYFPLAIREDKKLKEINFEGVIKLFIDSVKEVDGEPSCVGKDVKEMTWEELQSMACVLKLREIPLYQSMNIRTAREKAYETYMKVIKKKKVFKSAKDKKELRERIERTCEKLELSPEEVKERIDKAMEDAFDMTINPNNENESYDYLKLPALIAVPAIKKIVDNTAKK